MGFVLRACRTTRKTLSLPPCSSAKQRSACLAFLVAFLSPARSAELWAGSAWPIKMAVARGMPLEARLNEQFTAPDSKYPYEAVFTVSYVSKTSDGLPRQDQFAVLRGIAETLNQAILKGQTGKFAAIETYQNKCSYLFYMNTKQSAGRALSHLNSSGKSRATLTIREDKSWSRWRSIKRRFDG